MDALMQLRIGLYEGDDGGILIRIKNPLMRSAAWVSWNIQVEFNLVSLHNLQKLWGEFGRIAKMKEYGHFLLLSANMS